MSLGKNLEALPFAKRSDHTASKRCLDAHPSHHSATFLWVSLETLSLYALKPTPRLLTTLSSIVVSTGVWWREGVDSLADVSTEGQVG